MKEHFRTIFNSYSEVFFLQGYLIGMFMFVIILINPNVAIAGILSVLSAYIFAKFININRAYVNSGFYTYNPLLVGLSIGYLFKITPLTIFFVASMGVFTFVFTIMMYSIFSTYLKLPVLSLPFVIGSSIAYLASYRYSNLYVNNLYPHSTPDIGNYFPLWLAGFLKSIGAIFFSPNVIAGIVLSIIIFVSSRILFLLAVIGYFSGTLVRALMVGSFQQALSDINSFNFILIAMALGGVFLVPSIKSYIIAIVAVSISAILLDSSMVFWSYYGIPVFTLPFSVVTLTFIYVLGLLQFPLIPKFIKKTPEETLDYYCSNVLRYKGSERTIFLPFSGRWSAWQGFNGKWTHHGSWKYAYDFIINDDNSKSYRNDGQNIEDYYAYRKPVLSPSRGRVIKIVNDLPDNPIGQVDKTNNWGNLIIYQDYRGYFVEMSHFAHDSIRIKEGDWVERGTLLGLCGNSGYSPQPHIHVQVQLTEEVGACTLPFSFVSYASEGHFYSNNLPEENEVIETIYDNKELDIKTSFILDDTYTYDVTRDDRIIDTITLTVKMALDGTFYFDTGNGKLYFGKHEGTFYFYRVDGNDKYLKLFFLALPRLPLTFKDNMKWEDYIPIGLLLTGFKRTFAQFLTSFHTGFVKTRSMHTFKSKNLVEGSLPTKTLGRNRYVAVKFDDQVGFKTITVGNLSMERSEK